MSEDSHCSSSTSLTISSISYIIPTHHRMEPACNSTGARYVYDSVECFLSTWENGARVEETLNGGGDLSTAGFLNDAVLGKVSLPTMAIAHHKGKHRRALALAGRAAHISDTDR